MPYIIAVLALIIVGSGYALLQKKDVPFEVSNTHVSETQEKIAQDPSPTSAEPTSITNSPDTPSTQPTKPSSNSPSSLTPLPQKVPTSPATPTSPVPAPADTTKYTNGTYRTQSSYRTPDGTYQMDVTLTISNDSVTSASVAFDADGARDGYSKRFSSGYQSQVVGNSLEGLNLARVGGASLTTRAFNNALNTIRSQAS